jgi:hypothetical protein
MITGNTQLDYIITVLYGLLKTTVLKLISLTQKLFVYYPDAALICVCFVGAIVLYYFIKNAVVIVYSIIVNTLKLCLLLTVLMLVAWIYLRGFAVFQSDFRVIVDHSSKLDPNATYIHLQGLVVQVKRLWAMIDV